MKLPLSMGRHLPLIAALALGAGMTARAQLVNDGAARTLNGTRIDLGAEDLTVGTNGPNTRLTLTGGGRVTNAMAFVGLNSGSTNNSVTVTGNNSIWNSSGELHVGENGSFNDLLVTSGGTVTNTFGVLGFYPTASDNTITVRGASSAWNNRDDLTVGYRGRFNSLIITNGGEVTSGNGGTIGLLSPGNRAIITGLNSAWNTGGSISLGALASLNTLLITNRGVANSRFGTVGGRGFDNAVTVSGAGSAWNIDLQLFVGYRGSSNSLLVTSGGTVTNSSSTLIGWDTNALGNQVTVNGANSTWNNGGKLEVGSYGSFNALLVTNGATVNNVSGALGVDSGAHSNAVTVSGPGSTWNNSYTLEVGRGGSFNTLLVTGGATVTNSFYGAIGYNSNANHNAATVSGAGSAWKNSNFYLSIGDAGLFNTLLITNGGTVEATLGYIGYNPGAHSNAVTVTGASSVWNMRYDLYVGFDGSYNTLLITNSGTVTNSYGNIGWTSEASHNAVTVSGPNSAWNNKQLLVGSDGSFNTLLITDGGKVSSAYGTLGGNAGASSNMVVVSGPGAAWNSSLTVGSGGSFNTLLITDSGRVNSTYGDIGSNPEASHNAVTVSGANSAWNNSNSLNVAYRGSFNTLLITDGGTATNRWSYIGYLPGANSNAVIVSGPNSAWKSGEYLSLGSEGSFNTLLITNGASVEAQGAQVGYIGTNNQLVLDNGTITVANGLSLHHDNTLSGHGTINGLLTVNDRGILAPGASIGRLVLNTPPVLQGTVVMEISKSGVTLTNDQIQVTGTLTYGGALTVSSLGPDPLAAGDSFQFFNASDYSGEFSSLVLPPLPAGLGWTNRLLMDGSIAVVGQAVSSLGGFTQSGTNLVFNVTGGSPGGAWQQLTSTNVAAPLVSWITNRSGIFDAQGNAILTNGINGAEPKRYFLINTP